MIGTRSMGNDVISLVKELVSNKPTTNLSVPSIFTKQKLISLSSNSKLQLKKQLAAKYSKKIKYIRAQKEMINQERLKTFQNLQAFVFSLTSRGWYISKLRTLRT